jgi:hypothetical protein
MMANEPQGLGPISYVVVEFPGNKMTGNGLPILVDLVDRGIIRILDLLFVMREDDGTTNIVDMQDLDGDIDLTVFEGVRSGLLGDSDAEEAAAVLEPGSSAGILLFENRWALPFVNELRKSGAELISAGYLPQEELIAALDALENA